MSRETPGARQEHGTSGGGQLDAALSAKVKRLAEMIASSEEAIRFRQAQEKINRHPRAQALLFNVKPLRNRYSQTSLRLGEDHPQAIAAKQAYDDVVRQLEAIPLVEEYQTAQMELNDLLQGVIKLIALALEEEGCDVVWGKSDEVLGCGGSGCGGCAGGCADHGCTVS